MSDIRGKTKIGEGAYGIVYKGEVEKKNGKIREVAVKRNWGDKVSMGTSMIREMNFLKSLKHPCITRCTKISQTNPFNEANPLTPRYKGKEMKEDEYLFVMEYIETDLEKYYMRDNSIDKMIVIMKDILLGLEFMHYQGIMHRDLKPKNILVSCEGDIPNAKICDFGLSSYSTNYRPSTPGTVTAYYRAPEVCCCYDNYSFPIDIWAAGCIFYEIVTKHPLVVGERDTDKCIFKTIIKKISEKMSPDYISDFIKKGDITPFKHGYSEAIDNDKSSFKTRIIARIDTDKFERDGGNLDQFCDLLDNLLYLDPKKRLTSTGALNHPFFGSLKNYISSVRETYPPKPLADPELNIIDCIERRWAVNIAFRIFNKRDDVEWYNHHIIFHSLRLFDEYLSRYYESNKKREKSTTTMGKLHTKVEVHLFYFTCIYMAYKYFTTLYEVYSWKQIFPKTVTQNKSNLDKIVKFENFLLRYVCRYVFFKPTLLEYLDKDFPKTGKSEEEKDLDVKLYLYNYGGIDMDYTGTTKNLYDQITKKR